MNLEKQPISLSALEISYKEGEASPIDKRIFETASLPSCAEHIQQNEESIISDASSASSWLNIIQNKMKIQIDNQQQAPSILSSVPIINHNEISTMNTAQTPTAIIPPTAALQSLLSSATNNIAFNPYTIYSPFNNNNILNTFTFPNTVNNQINNNNNINNQINNNNNINHQINNNNNNNLNIDNDINSSVCVRSTTVKFLTMYYNTLHSNPGNLKRFYHLDAQIDRSDFEEFSNKTDKLSALKNVLFVDIEKILYQRSIQSSILIRVNGTMKFPSNINKAFEQIFVINKSSEGFWLIQNDILWLMECYDHNIEFVEKENIEQIIDANNIKTKQQPNDNHINGNMVNKRMINKFYHDSSYQQFDNNLAIFIRPIPNNITHSKLCGILRTNLVKQCNNNGHNIDICIDYIDVNYHKQFAFVYFGNEETLNAALEMNQMYINGQSSQIQRKRSHNGPRKFFPKKRKQII